MMRSMTFCCLLLTGAALALADPVTYTIAGLATGQYVNPDSTPATVGGQSTFANAPFTITLTSDTALIVKGPWPAVGDMGSVPSGFDPNAYASVGALSGQLEYGYGLVANAQDIFGFGAAGDIRLYEGGFGENPVMDLGSASFATYDLSTSLGPITADRTLVDRQENDVRLPSLYQFVNTGTETLGFTLTSISDATFTATVTTATPEPATWLLSALPVAALIGVRILRQVR